MKHHRLFLKSILLGLFLGHVYAGTSPTPGHCGPRLRSPEHLAPFLVSPLTSLHTGLEYDCCLSPKPYKKIRFEGQIGGKTTGSVGGRTLEMTWRLVDPELLLSNPVLTLFPGPRPGIYWWIFNQEAVATLEVTTGDNFALNKLVKISIPLRKGIEAPIDVTFGSGKTTHATIVVNSKAATAPFPCKH